MIWVQHPNPDRFKREVFQKYFEGAIQSEGAFLISNTVTGDIIGSTRFYDYDAKARLIKIGYTFFSRVCWGNHFNKEAKWLMLQHAFNYVDKVHFEVGAQNIRSQKAMERLGAEKIFEQEPICAPIFTIVMPGLTYFLTHGVVSCSHQPMRYSNRH